MEIRSLDLSCLGRNLGNGPAIEIISRTSFVDLQPELSLLAIPRAPKFRRAQPSFAHICFPYYDPKIFFHSSKADQPSLSVPIRIRHCWLGPFPSTVASRRVIRHSRGADNESRLQLAFTCGLPPNCCTSRSAEEEGREKKKLKKVPDKKPGVKRQGFPDAIRPCIQCRGPDPRTIFFWNSTHSFPFQLPKAFVATSVCTYAYIHLHTAPTKSAGPSTASGSTAALGLCQRGTTSQQPNVAAHPQRFCLGRTSQRHHGPTPIVHDGLVGLSTSQGRFADIAGHAYEAGLAHYCKLDTWILAGAECAVMVHLLTAIVP